ncbi:DeoR/GlpR family DNA-binding transcription regulator [Thermatribacter velox]|uniref:DeoR/GlpR family DNA-binding transcription regulator n=1 Tax=Thermatribacter velox TaxID=3039681 RepID=A0ABZ2YE56_9BACT
MIVEERRLKILGVLEEKKTVSVKELVKLFGVSEDTIRQDLRVLDRQRLLRRTYGGAVRIGKSSAEIPFSLREISNRKVKELIGREAVKLIEEGDSIIFDASTTSLQVARSIDPAKRVTILTTSLDICISLAHNPNFNIISTGGTLHAPSFSFVGPQAESAIRNYFADCLFLGAKAISLEQMAIADVFELEAHLKKTMIQSTRKVVLVAESSKLKEQAFFKIADLSAIHILVTDGDVDKEAVEKLEELGVEVRIARDS